MKYIILLILSFLPLASFASDQILLSAKGLFTCALDEEGVKCWGNNSHGQINVPQLNDVKQIAAGGWHSCALDAEGVKCWGREDWGIMNVPALQEVQQIAVGYKHACALDAEGVKCWGKNTMYQIEVPKLKNVKQIAAGAFHTCALDADGVKCWGDNEHGQFKVPKFKDVKQIAAGAYHTCALDAQGVKCWGNNEYGQTKVPALKEVKQIALGEWYSCALDSEGVKCWGRNNDGETTVPKLKNVKQITAGANHACALVADGVKCWGDNEYGQLNVPKLNFSPSLRAPEFTLTTLAEFLEVIASGSTPARTLYYNNLKNFIEASLKIDANGGMMSQFSNKAARYTLAALLAPAIRSGDSQYYVENVIPAYEASMKLIEVELGLFSLADAPDLLEVRLVALKVIQASLSVMNEFLTVDERKELVEVNRLLGTAMASVRGSSSIHHALVALASKRSLLNKLERSSKTSFLVESLDISVEFLNTISK